MRAFVIAGVLVASLAVPGAAQEAVEVKLPTPRVGDKVKVTLQEKQVSNSVITLGGMDTKKDETKAKSLVYVDEVLAADDGGRKPTKLKRTYEKAVLTTDGKETALPVEKQTVLIEKNGAKYVFTVDGKPVDEETLKLLSGEFNASGKEDARAIMFPKKPVKPGESWKIDLDQLAKAMAEGELKVEKDKLEANGKLLKAYKADGKQFGVVELKIVAKLADFGGKNAFKVKTGNMTITMTGDTCIDGTSQAGKSTAAMKLILDAEGEGIVVKATVTVTETRTTELVK